MRILLIEPYYTGSHRAWADGYARFSGHDVALLTHGGAFWKWRMHGAHLTLAVEAEQLVARVGLPDVVLAGSMFNLAGFLGAARSVLGNVPVAAYFHESQLGYPLSARDRPDLTYPMINWTSAAVADRVLFNSRFHRDGFFAALPGFLRQFPDHDHTELLAGVRDRSDVLAVGVDLRRLDGPAGSMQGSPPLIVWNQRWEYDKGLEEIAALIEGLATSGCEFRLALLGERLVSTPEVFAGLPGLLGDRLVAFGFAADSDYADLLRSADVVVSAARQEYFGVAITEAVYAGAFPVLPDALVYPERIPEAHHSRCLYDGPDDFARKVAWALDHPAEAAEVAAELRPMMARSDWGVMAPEYDATLAALAAPRIE